MGEQYIQASFTVRLLSQRLFSKREAELVLAQLMSQNSTSTELDLIRVLHILQELQGFWIV